jgi:hypothetical protein
LPQERVVPLEVAEGERLAIALTAAAVRLVPGGRLVAVEQLGGEPRGAIGRKGAGYGRPLLVTVEDAEGVAHRLVARTAVPDVFGHDRRADRAAELLLAFDTFRSVPDHVRTSTPSTSSSARARASRSSTRAAARWATPRMT